MEFRRITGAEHPLYEKAMELYAVSFPEHEQRLAALHPTFFVNDNGRVVGQRRSDLTIHI